MGRVRYSVFFLLGGALAFVAPTLADPNSLVPTLGASGAIAAVVGAFLITYPNATPVGCGPARAPISLKTCMRTHRPTRNAAGTTVAVTYVPP